MGHSSDIQKFESESGILKPFLFYQAEQIETLKEVLNLTRELNEFFYKVIIEDKTQYESFIDNVTDEVKNRLLNKTMGRIVIHFQTDLISEFRDLLSTYNRIGPYLYLTLYFEEILDGFLVFFNDLFDLSFIFRENNAPDGGKQWFEEHGFNLPLSFYDDSLKWIFDKLVKTGFFPNESTGME
jgi:hypothetical protein